MKTLTSKQMVKQKQFLKVNSIYKSLYSECITIGNHEYYECHVMVIYFSLTHFVN
jgi:hypothetical protein